MCYVNRRGVVAKSVLDDAKRGDLKSAAMGYATHPISAPIANSTLAANLSPVFAGGLIGNVAGGLGAAYGGWKLGDLIQRKRGNKSKVINALLALGLLPMGTMAGGYLGTEVGLDAMRRSWR